MRLPVVKAVVEFIQEHDEDYIHETVEVLECLAEAKGIKEEELMVIGEILSNLFGAVEVAKSVEEGQSLKQALNEFMKRVMGSIDPDTNQ